MDENDKLERILRSQGVPRSSWDVAIRRLSDKQRKDLASLVDSQGIVDPDAAVKYRDTHGLPRVEKAKTLPAVKKAKVS